MLEVSLIGTCSVKLSVYRSKKASKKQISEDRTILRMDCANYVQQRTEQVIQLLARMGIDDPTATIILLAHFFPPWPHADIIHP